MLLRSIYFSIIIFIFFSACSERSETTIARFNQQATEIRDRHIQDKALDVFKFRLTKTHEWLLEGETTKPEIISELRLIADDTFGKQGYTDQLQILPDPALGDSAYGLVIVSVTPLRREPRHASEILDQVILGNSLQLLQKSGGWYQVRNHYDYIGWINKTVIKRFALKEIESWKQSQKMQVTKLLSFVYEKPDENAFHLSDLVLNASVKQIKITSEWIQVELPDGRTGYVPRADLKPFQKNLDPGQVTPEAIVSTAKSMLGVPYLWGGKSSKANDCSGFTQTVFKANGIQLSRDARQQALAGLEISAAEDFANVKAGDLLFFGSGERITHVGISLGGYEFIHQDSDVHIDSFDPQADRFNKFRKKTLKRIKRILK